MPAVVQGCSLDLVGNSKRYYSLVSSVYNMTNTILYNRYFIGIDEDATRALERECWET